MTILMTYITIPSGDWNCCIIIYWNNGVLFQQAVVQIMTQRILILLQQCLCNCVLQHYIDACSQHKLALWLSFWRKMWYCMYAKPKESITLEQHTCIDKSCMDSIKLFTKLVMCYSNNNSDEVYLGTHIFYNFCHDWRKISKSKVILNHFDLDNIYVHSYLMYSNNNTHRCVNIDVQCIYFNCYAHKFYTFPPNIEFLNSSQSVWNTWTLHKVSTTQETLRFETFVLLHMCHLLLMVFFCDTELPLNCK